MSETASATPNSIVPVTTPTPSPLFEAPEESAETLLSAALAWLVTPRGGNNFYGRILNSCDRRKVPGLGTMGVSLTRRGRYLFVWDPEFTKTIPEPLRLMFLVHEAGHLAFSHLERSLGLRRLSVDDFQYAVLFPIYNVAMDMAVNDQAVRPLLRDPKIQGHRYYDDFIWPETRKYPPGRAFEEYLVMLLDDLKNSNWSVPTNGSGVNSGSKSKQRIITIGGGGNSNGDGSDSSPEKNTSGEGGTQQQQEDADGNASDMVSGNAADLPDAGNYPEWFKDMVESKIRNIQWIDVFEDATDGEIERALDQANKSAKKAVKGALEATEKARGTVPANLKTVIDNLLQEATVPWEQVLRMQVKSAISRKLAESCMLPSISLINSDWCEPYPGLQPEMTFNIMAFFDTSGSMSDEDFTACCSELAKLVDTEEGVNVRLVMFDAGLQHEEDVNSDDQDFRQLRTKARYGRGGTSFEEPVKYMCDTATEEDWVDGAARLEIPMRPVDLGIIFTDGFAPMPSFKPHIPLIWCLTHNGKEDNEMAQVVRMGRE